MQSAATILVALLLAAQVARLTAAGELAETRPGLAGTLAPQSPEVLLTTAMAEVGLAAGQGQLPAQPTMDRLGQLARSAPLHEQPVLVEAAVALRNGDSARAEQLLVEARKRDPRSSAARYLLADLWLRQGRAVEGLGELAVLTRLIRGGADSLAPALAQFAGSPGGGEQLKQVLRTYPNLGPPLLNALAADPANAELIFELAAASDAQRGDRAAQWAGKLLRAMIRQGEYQRAYDLWRRLAGLPAGARPLLFNGEFRKLDAPPPFNWTFTSGGAGFAEPGDGSMRVLHYGRENATLASQLLLLSPGRYRFAVQASGQPAAGSLAWVLKCSGGPDLFRLDLSKSRASTFQVPAGNCAAQSLELRGFDQDMPQESDVQVGPATIERAAL